AASSSNTAHDFLTTPKSLPAYALPSDGAPLLSSDGGALDRSASTAPPTRPENQVCNLGRKMSAEFNAERLAEILARIDPSQPSIEALSHWCVFHSRYCQQVVETWESEFRKAPCDRRKSLLYLANDIMQNTRKDDGGYIAEFMRVIPDALKEVYDTGDDSGRMAVKRLVDTPCGVEKKDHDSLGESTMSDERSKLPEDRMQDDLKHAKDDLEKDYSKSIGLLDRPGSHEHVGVDLGELGCAHALLYEVIIRLPPWADHHVAIWEDRKIFDSQEQSIKDGYLRRLKDLRNKLEKSEELLEKVVFRYKHVLKATKDEDNLLQKCKASIGIFDNLNATYENNPYLDNSCGSRFVEELQEQRSIIRNSIEKLKVSQSLRTTLISHLKEALYNQELEVTQVICQLQVFSYRKEMVIYITNVCSIMAQEAQERYKKANEICQNLGINVGEHQPSDQGLKRSTFSESFVKCFTHSDAGPLVPFLVGPAGGLVTGMPYGNFSPYPPAVNFPMANMPPCFPGAPNPPPAFRGSQGMFYGPPPYPRALPPMYRG
ncbi:hypothetical protein EJB05_00574, partial [Eragrostis curvula]